MKSRPPSIEVERVHKNSDLISVSKLTLNPQINLYLEKRVSSDIVFWKRKTWPFPRLIESQFWELVRKRRKKKCEAKIKIFKKVTFSHHYHHHHQSIPYPAIRRRHIPFCPRLIFSSKSNLFRSLVTVEINKNSLL